MRRVPALLILALAVGAAACDPNELMGGGTTDATSPAKAETKPETKPDAEAETKKVADDDYAVCMAGCTKGRIQSPTDQATCRLSCSAGGATRFSPGTSVGTKTTLARFEACVTADCVAPASATNAKTCRLTCIGAALASPGAPTWAPTARECAAQCLAKLGDCEDTCRGNRDDVATCKLQCTSLAEHCLGHCEQPVLR